MGVSSYEDLTVWQKSIDLVVRIYEITKNFPREEVYGLSDQVRRAAVSIPSNIAEGQQRQSTKDFLKFLSIAKGSLGELKTQLIICDRIRYLDQKQAEQLFTDCDVIGRMLNGLMKSISDKPQATDHL